MPNGRTDMFFPTVTDVIASLAALDETEEVATSGDRGVTFTAGQVRAKLAGLGAADEVMIEEQYGTMYAIHVGHFSGWPWVRPDSPAHPLLKTLRQAYIGRPRRSRP